MIGKWTKQGFGGKCGSLLKNNQASNGSFKKKPTYLFSIDAMRVLAILGVILIHTTTIFLNESRFNLNAQWFTLLLNQGARFAVPLFFLISGFVLELNHRKLSYTNFFKKRASRILIPYLFWSALYFALGNALNDFFTWKFPMQLLQGKASYQLYFIPTLILFYLAFPFFHKILHVLKKPTILVSILALQLILLSFDFYFDNLNLWDFVRIALLSWTLFLLGMIASHHQEELLSFSKKYFRMLVASVLFLLFVLFLQSKILYENSMRLGFIYSQYHPFNYLYTILIALTTYSYLETKRIGEKAFVKLSQLSFFVFFVHVFILDTLWKHIGERIFDSFQNEILTQFWINPLLFGVTVCLSFTVAFIAHKIPFLSKITG